MTQVGLRTILAYRYNPCPYRPTRVAHAATTRGRPVCPTAPHPCAGTGYGARTARSAFVPATSSGPMLWGSMQSDGSHTSPAVHNKSYGPLTMFPPTVPGDLVVDTEHPNDECAPSLR